MASCDRLLIGPSGEASRVTGRLPIGRRLPTCPTNHFDRYSLVFSGRLNKGGRSSEWSFFWISMSETSKAGETADTGTLPDSAPQYPLKTSSLSDVATILEKLDSGVPTISTPRTNSSGRPSAYTRYTITGITLNACSPARCVVVNPPVI